MNDAIADMRTLVDEVYRAESRRVLATLIRLLGDFDLAEEALHDAFTAARRAVAARRRAGQSARLAGLDRPLQGDRQRSAAAPASMPRSARSPEQLDDRRADEFAEVDEEGIDDDRLRLIFTCCHPALRRTRRSR